MDIFCMQQHLIWSTPETTFQHATHLLSIPAADKYILLFLTISFLASLSTVSNVSANIQLFLLPSSWKMFPRKSIANTSQTLLALMNMILYHTFAVQYDVLYCFSTAIWSFTKLLPSWGWCCAQWKDVWFPSGINYGWTPGSWMYGLAKVYAKYILFAITIQPVSSNKSNNNHM